MQKLRLPLIALSATTLIATSMQAHAASTTTQCAAPDHNSTEWDGIGALRGGKGYAPTPMGQVHYRLVTPENNPQAPIILLLHQTPWSAIQFADIQPCLASRGYASLAIDTPGYGMSDRPDGTPTIAQYAGNITAVLDYLKIDKVVVAGHHTGAAIAASFAKNNADRVRSIILHGAPNYTDEERAQRRSLPHPNLQLQADGSHLSGYFSRLYNSNKTPLPRNLATVTWSTLNIYLAGKSDVAHAAVYAHDMASDLNAITAPLLVLSDGADPLNPIDRRTATMRPNFSYHHFSEGSPHAMMVFPKRWADTVADFIDQTEKRIPKKH